MALSALSNNAWLSTEISSRETHHRYSTKVDIGRASGLAEATQHLRQFKDVVFVVGSYYSGTEKNLKTYLRSSHKSVTYNKLRALISIENSSADLDSLTVTAETALEALIEFGPAIIPYITRGVGAIFMKNRMFPRIWSASIDLGYCPLNH